VEHQVGVVDVLVGAAEAAALEVVGRAEALALEEPLEGDLRALVPGQAGSEETGSFEAYWM
jgi:hypothetical protein